MALTLADREYIKAVSERISSEVSERVIQKVLIWHTSSCPHGKAIIASKWAVIGGCVVVALGQIGATALIMSILS